MTKLLRYASIKTTILCFPSSIFHLPVTSHHLYTSRHSPSHCLVFWLNRPPPYIFTTPFDTQLHRPAWLVRPSCPIRSIPSRTHKLRRRQPSIPRSVRLRFPTISVARLILESFVPHFNSTQSPNMAGREPPYDPYIPSSSGGAGEHSGQNGENPRTAALQAVSTVSFDIDPDWMRNLDDFFHLSRGSSQIYSTPCLVIQRDQLLSVSKFRDALLFHQPMAIYLRVMELDWRSSRLIMDC